MSSAFFKTRKTDKVEILKFNSVRFFYLRFVIFKSIKNYESGVFQRY